MSLSCCMTACDPPNRSNCGPPRYLKSLEESPKFRRRHLRRKAAYAAWRNAGGGKGVELHQHGTGAVVVLILFILGFASRVSTSYRFGFVVICHCVAAADSPPGKGRSHIGTWQDYVELDTDDDGEAEYDMQVSRERQQANPLLALAQSGVARVNHGTG